MDAALTRGDAGTCDLGTAGTCCGACRAVDPLRDIGGGCGLISGDVSDDCGACPAKAPALLCTGVAIPGKGGGGAGLTGGAAGDGGGCGNAPTCAAP
jgi:hypothetical protein